MNRFKINDQVRVTRTSPGFQIYQGLVGSISAVFDVEMIPEHKTERETFQKAVIQFPARRSESHGGLWTPHPLEIFIDRIERLD